MGKLTAIIALVTAALKLYELAGPHVVALFKKARRSVTLLLVVSAPVD